MQIITAITVLMEVKDFIPAIKCHAKKIKDYLNGITTKFAT